MGVSGGVSRRLRELRGQGALGDQSMRKNGYLLARDPAMVCEDELCGFCVRMRKMN